jgi:LAS superfamily LD-carboxypeptidase LdcB
MKKKFSRGHLIFFLSLAIIAGLFAFLGFRLEKEKRSVKNELLKTKADFASTTKNLNGVINSLQENLAAVTAQKDDFEQKYLDQLGRMNLLDTQVQNIQSLVSVLDKLQKTDKELLEKYSKVYFLNENYTPAALIKIDSQYTYYPENDSLFYLGAWPFLQDLMKAANADGIDLKIISAYRSFGTQTEIKARHTMIYGSGANSFSADQGYSEHQLGTTVDLTTQSVGATFSGFEKTPAYSWLLANAYKYGFILSYPENNQYYQFEPWHWRFVGRELAKFLHDQGKNFYDLDQREIDQYLISIFN